MTVSPATYTDPYRPGFSNKSLAVKDQVSFEDVLDAINPLQHIPGLNLLYREVTGDTIKTPAAIVGGALYGGVIGFAGALAAAAYEALTGEAPAETVVGLVRPAEPAQSDAAKVS